MSNGSEHAPERDYKTLVGEARFLGTPFEESWGGMARRVLNELADAVEGLAIQLEHARNHQVTLDQVGALAAERDALLALVEKVTEVLEVGGYSAGHAWERVEGALGLIEEAGL